MTGVAEQTSHWLAGFTSRPPAAQAWLQAFREASFARFGALGFPDTHHEEWRFTNVAPIARQAWVPAARAVGAVVPAYADGWRVVFVNGFFAPELSTVGELAKGVHAGTLAADEAAGEQCAEQYLGKYAGSGEQAFVALNGAFFGDVAVVRVARSTVAERPIHLVYLTQPGAAAAVTHPRTLVVAGADSQCTIVESYLGIGAAPYFTNAVTEIVAGEGSVVDHYKVQEEAAGACHVATVQAQVGQSANFSSHSISLGGALVRNDINAVLAEGSHATLNGLYIVNGTQHVDNHTAIDHRKPHATSHEVYKGILDGRSSAVFNGKILVRQDAQKTDSKQTNKNLVLSDDAVIDTKPELQILADDVRCTHGATIGQLDAESMFYLQSRGIAKPDARNLLVYAFAQDIVDRIKVEPLRKSLETALFTKFHEHSD
jgi:Fe-S cluster assembly protein SufD